MKPAKAAFETLVPRLSDTLPGPDSTSLSADSLSAQAQSLPWWLRALVKRLEQANVSRVRICLAKEQADTGMALPTPAQELTLGQASAGVPIPRIKIHRLRAMLRGWLNGTVGWAEGYIAKDWDCDDIVDLTDWAMANETALENAFSGSQVSTWINRLLHRLNNNTRRGSRRNIAFHYDLGNDFYRLWLDSSMTYSSALFANPQQSLVDAQCNKNRRILELLDPKPGHKVLEVGCGWGGFGETLMQHSDCQWHGVTLSKEQLAWSQQRLEPYADRAKATLTDYRDIDQQYDRIVSIEMLEAVGEANWPEYFKQLKRHLKPGGKAVIQVITIDNDRFTYYRDHTDFIQRYIFPGGMLPSPDAMRQQLASAGLQLQLEQSFGQDYATTLQHWHRNFCSSWPQIEPQGFDPHFYRLWRYYLAYCESGFKAGSIDVRLYQIQAPH
jgi:cyclopropane-fatty-acyl-phospholipid synthase